MLRWHEAYPEFPSVLCMTYRISIGTLEYQRVYLPIRSGNGILVQACFPTDCRGSVGLREKWTSTHTGEDCCRNGEDGWNINLSWIFVSSWMRISWRWRFQICSWRVYVEGVLILNDSYDLSRYDYIIHAAWLIVIAYTEKFSVETQYKNTGIQGIGFISKVNTVDQFGPYGTRWSRPSVGYRVWVCVAGRSLRLRGRCWPPGVTSLFVCPCMLCYMDDECHVSGLYAVIDYDTL